MAKILFTNNAESTISGGLASGGTTVVLATGTGDRFPSPSAGDYFLLTLYEKDISAVEWRYEVVKVTGRVADTLTILRDVENTTGDPAGYTYPSTPGLVVYASLRWTAGGAATMTQNGDNLASLTSAATARSNLGLGNSAVLSTGTTAGTVATGDHAHSGYEPADATILKSAAIGVSVAAQAHNHTGTYEPANATILKSAAIGVSVQAYDVDTAKLDVAQAFTAQQTFKELKDTVHTITDGAAFEIDPGNGSVQIVTLGASRTPAATNFEAGQTVLLGINDGTAYSVTWTTVAVTWVKAGGTGVAPTLATSGYTWVLLTKIGSTIYGAEWGKP